MESTEDLINIYSREIAIIRGVKPNTVKTYNKILRGFLKWLGKSPLTAVRSDFLAWREEESKHRKPGGLQLYISGIKSFYAWLTETQRIPANPCPGMIVHKSQVDPSLPTTSQFLDMRKYITNDLRKSALIEFLAGSGLRIDAALAVTKEQLILDEEREISPNWRSSPNTGSTICDPPTTVKNYVKTTPDHCKGYRANLVPMTPCSSRALQRYLKNSPPKEGQPIFNFSYANAYRIVRMVGNLGAGVRVSPHSLRRFYGCLMYYRNLEGAEHDVIWVRDAMGHSSISVTDTYLRMARVVVRNEVDWHSIVWHGLRAT